MSVDPPAPTEPLPSLVARSVQHINALRRQGNPAAVLAPATARERYLAANAPGLALLTEGYLAINRQLARQRAAESTHANGDTLEQVCSKITAGGFKDAADRVAQLHTALEVFSRA